MLNRTGKILKILSWWTFILLRASSLHSNEQKTARDYATLGGGGGGTESHNSSCVKVHMDVLGSLFLIVLMVYVDVKQQLKEKKSFHSHYVLVVTGELLVTLVAKHVT